MEEGELEENEEVTEESRTIEMSAELVRGKFVAEGLCLGQVYDMRWRTTRAEWRKKTREKRRRTAEKLEILLEATLAEAEEQRQFWEAGQDLDKIVVAWEASAKDLKWRIPAGTTKFTTLRVLESERVKDPFEKERVEKILKVVTIGDMVKEEQRIEVEEFGEAICGCVCIRCWRGFASQLGITQAEC